MRADLLVWLAALILAASMPAKGEDDTATKPSAKATVGDEYACDEHGAGTVTILFEAQGLEGPMTCIGPSPDLPITVEGGRCDIPRVIPGHHTFEAIDQEGRTVAQTVTVPEPIFVNVVALEPPTACGRTDGTIIMAAHGTRSPFRFRWNGAEEDGPDRRRDLAPGTHTIQVLDGQGCFETIQVTVPALQDCDSGDDG